MEGSISRVLISSRSVDKHGHHRQFLFLIGWFLKSLLLWNRVVAKWTDPLVTFQSQFFFSDITGANGPYMIFISLGNKYIAARPIMVWLTETSTFFFPENKYLFIRTAPYGFFCQSNIKATRFSFWQWTNA